MAPTIQAVMEGIEARLATIAGLRSAAIIPDQITVPQAVVGVPSIPMYHQTMGMGRFRLEPTVTVFVSTSLDRIGQMKLAGYANPTGASSIRAAIEGDRTLGGVVDDCIVTDFQSLGMVTVGAIEYLAGQFTLQVIATGT